MLVYSLMPKGIIPGGLMVATPTPLEIIVLTTSLDIAATPTPLATIVTTISLLTTVVATSLVTDVLTTSLEVTVHATLLETTVITLRLQRMVHYRRYLTTTKTTTSETDVNISYSKGQKQQVIRTKFRTTTSLKGCAELQVHISLLTE